MGEKDKIRLLWEAQSGRIYRVWSRNQWDINEPWFFEGQMGSTTEDGVIRMVELPVSDPMRFYLLEVLLETP